ncbi:MAG: hypothetical protein KGY99_07625 [Phycisphaerae bacterium]|nr:hypothetical protein [Phycisphaerae bacterium]
MPPEIESPAEDEWQKVDLPNHPRSDYADILDALPGEFPAAWEYEVPAAWDADAVDHPVESEDLETEGLKAEAWIDLSGDHAVVWVNPNHYADAPPDTLDAEAERVLLEWAADARRRSGAPASSPAAPEPPEEGEPGQPPSPRT